MRSELAEGLPTAAQFDMTEKMYEKPFSEKILADRKKLSKEEKEALRKDEIDDISTSELEEMDEIDHPEEFLERHGINLAKAFLGKDGGYSIRKLKKMYVRETNYRI